MSLVLDQRSDAVCTLVLNRESKLNALNREMYNALTESFRSATADPLIKVIVIKGQPGIFTAGNDIADFAAAAAQPERRDNPAVELMKAMLDTDMPIVAGVDGPAIGIGTTLLFHCDLVYASNQARFHTPFAALGVCPEFASSATFSELMGHHRAAEMLLLCEPLNAQKGYDYGFVNDIVDSEKLDEKLAETSARLASLPNQALATSRRMIHHNKARYLEIIESESAQFGELMRSDEFRQNMQKFINK